MKSRHSRVFGLVMLVAGCATTSITDTYKSPTISQSPRPEKVLVVALVPQEDTRQQLELALVTKLSEKGIVAQASSQVLGARTPPSNENVQKAVADQGFDTLLVSRFTGVQDDMRSYWGMGYNRYYGYFGSGRWGFGPYESNGYWDASANMQTSIFNAQNNQLVWSAATNTPVPEGKGTINGLAGVIVNRLEKNDILG